MLERTEVSADVLVIGGGMAGAMAALEAAKHGGRVVLADKGVLGRGGSSCTSGGALAFPSSGPGTTETGDSPDCYYDDIMAGGEVGVGQPGSPICVSVLDQAPGSKIKEEECRTQNGRRHQGDQGEDPPWYAHPRRRGRPSGE